MTSDEVLDMLVTRKDTFDEMNRLYRSWLEVGIPHTYQTLRMTVSTFCDFAQANAGQPTGLSRAGPRSLPFSNIDWEQMKDHLNMFLAKAAKSEAVRLSFKRLRDQSAESFIELLDEVSVNSIDTVVSELNLSKVLKDGATSEDINLLVRCNRALRSVCKSSCLLPKDIRISTSLVKESDRPVAGGAYGDVWKGRWAGQSVAIKTIRTFGAGTARGKQVRQVRFYGNQHSYT